MLLYREKESNNYYALSKYSFLCYQFLEIRKIVGLARKK